MYYMSTDFGADSSSRFPFRTRSNRHIYTQTNIQTQLNALPHAGSYTAGVGNDNNSVLLHDTLTVDPPDL